MADRDPTKIPAQIDALRRKRSDELQTVARHREGRLKALAKRDWETARAERRIMDRHRERAQECLSDIRALRKEYHIHNVLVRKLRHRRRVIGKEGLTWYDGHQVATWIVNDYLIPARKDGIYFRVTSGVRTLSTAQYLWNNAARLGLVHYVSVAYPCSSNHCGYIFPKGAVDLYPYNSFRLWLHGHQTNRALLSYTDVMGNSHDLVHFSHTGH